MLMVEKLKRSNDEAIISEAMFRYLGSLKEDGSESEVTYQYGDSQDTVPYTPQEAIAEILFEIGEIDVNRKNDLAKALAQRLKQGRSGQDQRAA